jgi:hypothetical protein
MESGAGTAGEDNAFHREIMRLDKK